MNIKKYKNIIRKHINLIVNKYKKHYQNNLAIVAIIKNEAPYIREWIEFHKLAGVDKFYIYNNESTDNIEEVLNPYIKNGLVTYRYFPGEAMQIKAYQDAILKYKFHNKYMAFIDVDEFLLPISGENIFDIVDNIIGENQHTGGLAVQWCVYGSSGHKTKPEGLVIENYLWHATENFIKESIINRHIKSICNPRKVNEFLHCHYPKYWQEYYSVNTNNHIVKEAFTEELCWDKLRINHYFSKSYEEFLQKRARGRASRKKGVKCELSDFQQHDLNDVEDRIILKYVDKLKEKLAK